MTRIAISVIEADGTRIHSDTITSQDDIDIVAQRYRSHGYTELVSGLSFEQDDTIDGATTRVFLRQF